jgi:hypothetical protein
MTPAGNNGIARPSRGRDKSPVESWMLRIVAVSDYI